MKKILFVCLGNICRSPAAEAIMNALLLRNGLSDQVVCDSAGTGDYHVGEAADRRMIQCASKRGYKVTSIARQIDAGIDFDHFDYIVAMDQSNVTNIKKLERRTGELSPKLVLMREFSSALPGTDVPDPYFGGPEGFEEVMNILEDACQGFIDRVFKKNVEGG